MRTMAPLDLTTSEAYNSIEDMEWRPVTVTGEYDFANQVVLRNQYNQEQYGYHIITPLLQHFDGSVQAPTAVFVDRGWIPADGNSAPGRLAQI